MTTDAPQTQSPAVEPRRQPTMWSALTGWWSSAATTTDPALGYESAQPWVLGVDTPADGGETPY